MLKLTDPSIVEDNVTIYCRHCGEGWVGDGARLFADSHPAICPRKRSPPHHERAMGETQVKIDAGSEMLDAVYIPPPDSP